MPFRVTSLDISATSIQITLAQVFITVCSHTDWSCCFVCQDHLMSSVCGHLSEEAHYCLGRCDKLLCDVLYVFGNMQWSLTRLGVGTRWSLSRNDSLPVPAREWAGWRTGQPLHSAGLVWVDTWYFSPRDYDLVYNNCCYELITWFKRMWSLLLSLSSTSSLHLAVMTFTHIFSSKTRWSQQWRVTCLATVTVCWTCTGPTRMCSSLYSRSKAHFYCKLE